MIDGLCYAIGDGDTDIDTQDDNAVTVNIKYELDKEAYRRFVADMKQLEAEFKSNNETKTINTCYEGSMQELIEKLGYTIRASSDGKSLRFDHMDYDKTTKHIPAKLKDVCEWWISEYRRDSTPGEHTIESNIAENMEYIMKRKGW